MRRDDGSRGAPLRVDALFWRRLARLGATRFPRWWLRYSPPVFGLAAAALVPSARRAVARNLTRTRGPTGKVREAVDVARTFVTYAGALAEGLASGSKNARPPEVNVVGDKHLRGLPHERGVIIVTAHTAGWEIAGPLLLQETGMRVMMAMQAERDQGARDLHDATRRAQGLEVLHVGDDPFASLALLRHVRGGGAAALQLDRVPPGIRARTVRMFDGEGKLPEGPFRLAQLAGAPIVTVFCARAGFNRYLIEVGTPIVVPRRATEAQLDAAAQTVADAMTRFLRAHPTQWLMFQ